MMGTSLNTEDFSSIRLPIQSDIFSKDTPGKQYKDVCLNVKPERYFGQPMFRLQDMDCHLNAMTTHEILDHDMRCRNP
jgi:hypothetical protein